MKDLTGGATLDQWQAHSAAPIGAGKATGSSWPARHAAHHIEPDPARPTTMAQVHHLSAPFHQT
jgi:hypothetical protein